MNIIKLPSNDVVITSGNITDSLKPYERDIYLFSTHIAGSTHVDNIGEIMKNFKDDEIFSFFREPDNEYDPRAIIIKNYKKEKLGYVPEVDNIIFSRLMDAGKLLFGKLKKVEIKGKWSKIYIDIYLKD